MKRKIFILNFLAVVILVFSISAAILHRADDSVRSNIEEQRKTVRTQIGDKLKSFDLFMLVIASKMEERAEKALLEINTVLGDSAAKGIGAEPDALRRLADEKGVGEIYLINSNGIVFSTSNRREQGFSLVKAGKTLSAFLSTVYGSGEFAHGRISVGMVSGRAAMFSYYSPKGSRYIVETAVYLEDYLAEQYGVRLYEYFFRDFFNDLIQSCVYTKSIDVFTKFRVSGYSLFNFKKEFPLEGSYIDRLKEGSVIEKKDGDTLYEYSAFRLENSEGGFAETYYLEVVYDFSEAGDSVMKSAYAAVLSVGLSGILLFLFLNCALAGYGQRGSQKNASGVYPDDDDKASLPDSEGSNYADGREKGSYRILLADDSEYNRFVTESYLEGTECTLDYAESGFAALEKFTVNKYDMVLTDIQMPGMDGYELTRKIRAFEASTGMKRTPVIAITAYDLEREAKRCLEAGCDAYVAKPLNRDMLLKTMSIFREGQIDKPSMPAEGEDGLITVIVKSEFSEVTPLFLKDLKETPSKIRNLLENEDFESIQFIGHRLKGEAKTFGFEPVSDYGLYIQGAAIRRNSAKIEEIAGDLHEYSSKIRLIFDKKSV